MSTAAITRIRKDYQSRGLTTSIISRFRRIICAYYKTQGRRFPWRETDDPYQILVSEIMLQQTQASRVVAKYAPFIAAFPDVKTLAAASLRDVLAVWQGLGYNRRAMNLKSIAEIITREHGGILPSSVEELETLPGIGKNTAGAIIVFAFNRPTVFIETNIRTVYHYFFFPLVESVPDSLLRPLIEATVDTSRPREWYYALYDYGAMLKREKKATDKPKNRQSRFEGSDRQLRGAVLRTLLARPGISEKELADTLQANLVRLRRILEQLETEGFLELKEKSVYLR